jgi:hypothetical protein
MKKILVPVLLLIFVFNANADDDKFVKAMEKNIAMIDTASSLSSFQNIANSFERIANAEKDKWLPYYYSAYLLTISSFVDTVIERKDTYLDKAEELVVIADSLEPDNSEICTLRGLIAQARLVVDPQNRWSKYGPLSTNYLSKAKELDPTNPRPDFLNGQSVLNTPEQFGGGVEKALPILKESEEKFKNFEPESSIHPNWGEKMLQQVLQSIEASN